MSTGGREQVSEPTGDGAHSSGRLVNERIELAIGVAAIGILLIGCFLVLRPFLSALLWGTILAYTTWPLYRRLVELLGNRWTVAAIVMTVLLALAFVAPLVLVGSSAADGIARLIEMIRELYATGLPDLPAWIANLPILGAIASEFWEQLAAGTSGLVEILQPYLVTLRDFAITLGVGVGSGILEITLSVFAAFFFYRDGEFAVQRARAVGGRLIGDRASKLFEVAGVTIKGVVYGVIGTALIQGGLSGIGFWVVGIPSAFVLGFICFFLALLPFGPPVVWIPIAIWLFSQGELWRAVFLVVWGLVVVGSSDNFIRPWLISRSSRLTFLPVFLGVVGGAVAFGFLGIFLGPVLLAVGFAVLNDWVEPEVAQADRRAARKRAGRAPG
jgi:predicted PurR-regulated permease PerM